MRGTCLDWGFKKNHGAERQPGTSSDAPTRGNPGENFGKHGLLEGNVANNLEGMTKFSTIKNGKYRRFISVLISLLSDI